MFEEMTYDNILAWYLSLAPDGIDTRQGSIYYDAVSPMALQESIFYANLNTVYEMTQLDTATGDALDAKASEKGLTRRAAIAAEYYITFTGTQPEIGDRFFVNGLYWALMEDDDGNFYIQCETTGDDGNGIASGTAAVPVNTINGLESAVIGEAKITGDDEESDDSLRERIKEKISGPAQDGNKQQYQTWCEAQDGVGLARIVPLWNGPNTVQAILIATDGSPCPSAVVSAVQEYIDPATKGYTATVDGVTYTVGDGIGEGVAPLGAHFTACAPRELSIAVSFSATPQSGYSIDNIQAEAEKALDEYIKGLNLATRDGDLIVIRYTNIGAILSGLSSLLDYSDLTVNGGTENIYPGNAYAAVLGEVTVSEL